MKALADEKFPAYEAPPPPPEQHDDDEMSLSSGGGGDATETAPAFTDLAKIAPPPMPPQDFGPPPPMPSPYGVWPATPRSAYPMYPAGYPPPRMPPYHHPARTPYFNAYPPPFASPYGAPYWGVHRPMYPSAAQQQRQAYYDQYNRGNDYVERDEYEDEPADFERKSPTVPEWTAEDEAEEMASERVGKTFAADLKAVLRKDIHRKLLETTVFPRMEVWFKDGQRLKVRYF